MPAGEGVLPLEIEGAGQLQADANEAGVDHQHPAEDGDRLVEQLVPPVAFGRHGGLDRLHAIAKHAAEILRCGGEGKAEHQNHSGQETSYRNSS